MPYVTIGSEIRHRVKEPSLFKEDTIRSLDIGKWIRLIRGRLKSNDEWATQAIRFDKDKFDVGKAKTWVEGHPNIKKYSESKHVEDDENVVEDDKKEMNLMENMKKKHDIKNMDEMMSCKDIGGG